MPVTRTSRLFSAVILGALASAAFVGAGSAAPIGTAIPAAPHVVAGNVHSVQYHGERYRGDGYRGQYRGDRADHREDLRYDRRRHGERHRARRHGYTHYYNGYYYATPWWAAVPAIRIPHSQPARPHRTEQRHVRWCFDQYRNYNPETNTYIGRGGRRYVCKSPFY